MTEHDYMEREWSRDYAIDTVKDGGHQLNAHGWGRGIREGDYLLLANGPEAGTRYRVKTIRYTQDPPDMWFAELRFAPR
jgi:hypothetical protein